MSSDRVRTCMLGAGPLPSFVTFILLPPTGLLYVFVEFFELTLPECEVCGAQSSSPRQLVRCKVRCGSLAWKFATLRQHWQCGARLRRAIGASRQRGRAGILSSRRCQP